MCFDTLSIVFRISEPFHGYTKVIVILRVEENTLVLEYQV